MILETILLVLAICLISYVRHRFSHAGRCFNIIPGPKGWPILGNAPKMSMTSEEIFTYVRKLCKIYDGIYKLEGLHIRTVSIYTPDDVEKILSTTRFNEKQQPYTFLKPWLCEGLLTSNRHKWQQRRKLLTPSFHFAILRQFARTFNEQTQELVDKVGQEAGKARTDLLPLITRATLQIMCETSMGTSMHEGIQSVSNKYFNALHFLGQCAVYRITKAWLYVDWMFSITKLYMCQKKALKDLHAFTNQIIQERKVYRQKNKIADFNDNTDVYGKRNRLAMLDLLLENEKEGKIDVNGIREEVDTFMFEGHDTTAMGLCFMLIKIANEPQVQGLIYEEMQNIFGDSDRLPSVEDLNEMKYLECCIKESLRLYPSVPFIARYISEEVTLSGYKVPAGTICYIHVYDLHRCPDVFSEPERFIPERFLPNAANKIHPYAYIPFSAGPRNCIGQKFAMLEMKTVVSTLLRRYRLEPVTKPEDIVFTADMVLRANHPLYVRFCDRTKSI